MFPTLFYLGSESAVCVDLLDEFPRLIELDMEDVEVIAHETPILLR